MQISGLPASSTFGAADVLAIEINGVTYKITGATLAAALQSIGDYVTAQDIVNNLTTTDEGHVLDARQGKALLDAIEALGAADVGAVAADQGAANAGKALVVGNDGNVTTGKAVRPDVAQTLTAAEQAQARGNIGAAADADVDDLKSALNKCYPSLSYVDGYIKANGSLDGAYASFKTTQYIEATDHIYLSGTFRNLSGQFNYVNCYDKDKNFISGLVPAGQTYNYDNEKITLPTNTIYIRISDATVNHESISLIVPVATIADVAHINSTEDDAKDVRGWLGFGAFSKFATVGDSLSVGYRTLRDGTVLSSDKPNSWPAFIKRRTGTDVYWTGSAGETSQTWLETTSTSWGLNYCRTLGEMPLYVYCMGANEGSITIGTIADINDENPTTLYGYVGKVIRELKAISPDCIIVCTGVSRKQNSHSINDVYQNVCNALTNCYYIDCETEFNSEPLVQYYYKSHYTLTGYAIIAKMFDEKLREIMINNPSDFLFIE